MIAELSILAASVPCADHLERSHVERFLELLEKGPQVFDRNYYGPGHVTASSFVVHPTEASVALIHHAKLGAWLQPGGHLEPSDATHEMAARREVKEETGLEVLESLGVIDLDIHTFPERGGRPEHLHFDLRWAFQAGSGTLAAGDGVTGVRWVPFSQAMRMERSLARPVAKLAGSLAPRS